MTKRFRLHTTSKRTFKLEVVMDADDEEDFMWAFSEIKLEELRKYHLTEVKNDG